MKKLLAVLTLLAFFLLLWFAKKKHQTCCESYVANQEVHKNEQKKPVKETEVVEKQGPLLHKWGEVAPITNDLWVAKKNEIISQKESGKILRIVGGYFSDEKNTSNYQNMGLARAHKILELFSNDLDTSKVALAARVIPFKEGVKTAPFEETVFSWVVSNDNVKEDETGKALIYFPHGSAKEIKNKNILDYIKTLVEKAKANNKTIFITGYTDNTGGDATKNLKLGLRRANTIKQLLIQYGIAKDKVQADSKGIENPIASNETKAGRAKNRRVEIELK